MEFLEVVGARRCIRKFAATDVSEELLKSLIECALRAPSSMNGQPWYFILVRSRETKRQLAELKELACPYGQGYYIARPMDPAAMRTLLSSAMVAVEPEV